MLNLVELQGRLGKDIDLRYSAGENATAIGRFSLGVPRNFKGADGKYETDWISCVVFGKTAENMEKFFGKGDMVIIVGRIQTGSYTNKEGNKVYTTDVVVNEFQFCGSKNTDNGAESGGSRKGVASNDGFIDTSEIEDELPFN